MDNFEEKFDPLMYEISKYINSSGKDEDIDQIIDYILDYLEDFARYYDKNPLNLWWFIYNYVTNNTIPVKFINEHTYKYIPDKDVIYIPSNKVLASIFPYDENEYNVILEGLNILNNILCGELPEHDNIKDIKDEPTRVNTLTGIASSWILNVLKSKYGRMLLSLHSYHTLKCIINREIEWRGLKDLGEEYVNLPTSKVKFLKNLIKVLLLMKLCVATGNILGAFEAAMLFREYMYGFKNLLYKRMFYRNDKDEWLVINIDLQFNQIISDIIHVARNIYKELVPNDDLDDKESYNTLCLKLDKMCTIERV